MHKSPNSILVLFLIVALCAPCFAWHTPHELITRAALQSLPESMRQKWATQSKNLIEQYCWYPDIFHNAKGDERAKLQPYCEKPDGKPIHNVTWRRAEDLASLEFALNGVISNIQRGDAEKAAKFAGTLAHLLEDSTCPAHAFSPMDVQLNYIRDLIPPPPGKEDIKLHTVIEKSAPNFTLGARAPQRMGKTVSEAAVALLDRCYGVIRENRAGLLELTRAAYMEDEVTMDRFRLKAARSGAELLADALFTAFILAE